METAAMGKVLITARIENISDSLAARGGQLRPEQVRAVEVTEAIVDTGAKLLGLPRKLELLDFVVDPVARRLIPHPKNGAQRLLELY